MSDVRSYRDLKVWQQAMDIAVGTYELTKAYPREELFGLTSQSRRAASSIAANIAEGYGRASKASYLSFLRIARGSLKELETHLILADRVGLSASGKIELLLQQTDELGRMLHGLIARVQGRPAR
ncbi:MAG: four helix bundle protein [Alphaproteobacteria bacterium]|jgi:four helix bundle protein|nr:four helix bundle protein [Alphaproteobacteria bacterium]MBU2041585.1 four helix bundle protein [Alphaproteobacteria bacterium]MBU2125866.1 four helix bundle protein [Alphaproteobacteria bacterium]MBU2207634.1 four helix bundle protein [Alphaproteobacteria bacterium]MBU2292012.1 four helix bundle protein [Alphaproteobacteria bacterium]